MILTLTVGTGVVLGARLLSRTATTWFLVLPVVAVTFASVIVIPVYLMLSANGVLGGLGGDRGQALDIALDRLISGLYPYAALTYDGGQITPLPGALLLAAPARFVLGDSGMMTAYLVPLALALLWRVNIRLAAVVALAVVAAPAFWADALSHGDLVTTSLLVFSVAAIAVTSAMNDSRTKYWWAVALGVSAATRVTSVLVILVVVAILAARGRWRVGIVQGVVAIAVVLVLSLPLYVINPEEFSPLHTSSFIRGGLGITLALVIVVAMLVSTARYFSWVRWWPTSQLALVLSILAVALTAVPMIVEFGDVTLFTSGYAVMGLLAPATMLAAGVASGLREAPRRLPPAPDQASTVSR